MSTVPGARVQPFHCPYCGEQNLRPAPGGHHCRDCDRRFALTFQGLGAADPPTDPTDRQEA